MLLILLFINVFTMYMIASLPLTNYLIVGGVILTINGLMLYHMRGVALDELGMNVAVSLLWVGKYVVFYSLYTRTDVINDWIGGTIDLTKSWQTFVKLGVIIVLELVTYYYIRIAKNIVHYNQNARVIGIEVKYEQGKPNTPIETMPSLNRQLEENKKRTLVRWMRQESYEVYLLERYNKSYSPKRQRLEIINFCYHYTSAQRVKHSEDLDFMYEFYYTLTETEEGLEFLYNLTDGLITIFGEEGLAILKHYSPQHPYIKEVYEYQYTYYYDNYLKYLESVNYDYGEFTHLLDKKTQSEGG